MILLNKNYKLYIKEYIIFNAFIMDFAMNISLFSKYIYSF